MSQNATHPEKNSEQKWSYDIRDGRAFVTLDGKRYATDYSLKIIELIVRRKGAKRLPLYLGYRETRGPKVTELLNNMARENKNIAVLEPGCSAGHISEIMLRHEAVGRVVSFDADKQMIDVCREKKRHFKLDHWELAHAHAPDFTDDKFDLVLLSAVMEHVDPEKKRALIEGCFHQLKIGGLLVVMESFNRRWPFEYHVIRLPIPYLHLLPPKMIYKICLALGRYGGNWSFDEFNNPNTGWRGTTYRELLPQNTPVEDVTSKYGLGAHVYRVKWDGQGMRGTVKTLIFSVLSIPLGILGVNVDALLPALYIALEKKERPV